MTAARRLVAILAVDVVGYSRLMSKDEAGTAKAVRERCEAAIPIRSTRTTAFPQLRPRSTAVSK
jgi:class 3 adenylate cyclase